jgi:sulfate/thiosulfate transport system substrate-binding protein
LCAAAVAATAVTAGCRPRATGSAGASRATLVLGAYTTPREVYGKAVIPAFRRFWKAKTGQNVEFQESYQGSGAQARAIVGGFEADVAALSLEPDVDQIASAGLIHGDWRSGPHRGIVTTSIVVLAVRKGNPKKITGWADLARPGTEVLTPDPKTSGGARWNINAMYGAALRGDAGVGKGDRAAAQGYLRNVFKNVRVMDKGARESITTFERGVGDVAVTYENEVLVARKAGQDYDYVVPHSTILIENPVAVVDAYADKHRVRPQAEAFVRFLSSPEAQRAFADFGLRPADEEVARSLAAKFPAVADLWRVDFLGGWKRVAIDVYGDQGAFTRAFASSR